MLHTESIQAGILQGCLFSLFRELPGRKISFFLSNSRKILDFIIFSKGEPLINHKKWEIWSAILDFGSGKIHFFQNNRHPWHLNKI